MPESTDHRAHPHPQFQKWRWWYDAVIDWMILNPGGTMLECAKDLDRSYSYLSLLTNSDLFKARLEERRRSLSTEINQTLTRSAGRVALKALEKLDEAMDTKVIPPATLNEIAKTSFEALGFGAKNAGVAVPTQQVHVHVGREVLVQAREHMRTIEGQYRQEDVLKQIEDKDVEDVLEREADYEQAEEV